MPERRDGDRTVVTGKSAGSHFPRTHEMLQYAWTADGTTTDGPYRIPGSVYGRDLVFEGPGEVDGPVLGRGDIAIRPAARPNGRQRFACGVAATGSVVVDGATAPLTESLVRDLAAADVVVRGDVLASSVRLRNTIVFGNVEAARVHLDRCIVVGAVVAKEIVTVAASSILYYHAPRVTFEGPCTLLHAMGESHEPPVFAAYEDAGGQVWPASVVYYPAVRAANGAGLTQQPWAPRPDAANRAVLKPGVDWVRVEADVPVAKLRDGRMATETERQTRHVLTIAGRCLDFRPVARSIDALAFLLRSGLEWEHYGPRVREEVRALWQGNLTPEEQVLMRMVTEAAA